MSKIDFEEYINDPLHGPVGITRKELKIIHTRTFQRLKNIKQLGTANFVYPGANHSRFEHSIGTMHLTSLVLNRLQEWDKPKEQTIRLAALLHDIGHGPFSHTFEELLTRNEEYVSVFKGKKLRDHEDYSQFVLRRSNELGNILGSERHRIADFLSGEEPIGGIPGEIITGDMGTDRLDYLLRDTYYAGLGHRPDIQSLISSLRILATNKAYPRLAIENDGILAAEFLITTRYYHYSMIVHNPKTRSVELLFIKLLESFLKTQKDPKGYLFEAFTQYDDNIVLGDMFRTARLQKFAGVFRRLFYKGKSFNPVYSINIRQLRSGLTKYCIYRFFYDRKGLIDYVNTVSTKLREAILSDDLIFDVHLFKHDVPDMIYFAHKYESKKEWISPFLIDRSNILRLIPSEQLLQSLVCVMSKKELNEEEERKLYDKVEEERRVFLVRDALVPITKKSMNENGFQLIDDFYTFLCALRDFYEEKPWKETVSSSQRSEIFRGISRFYDLVNECQRRTDRIGLPFKRFFKSERESFPYSTKGFSILNALATMNILRLEYIPSEKQEGKPFHFAYLIKPVERDIRRTVYEGIDCFDKLRLQFCSVFRKLDWDRYFAEFFPLKAQ